MKVKVGDTWYDANEQPLCVELSEQDKINIANMDPEATKYAVFPEVDETTKEWKLEWMGGVIDDGVAK